MSGVPSKCAIRTNAKHSSVELRLSIVKSPSAQWMVELYDYLKGKSDIIHNGFKEAGLLKL